MKIIVTTTQRGLADQAVLNKFLQDTGFAFTERQSKSIHKLQNDYQADGIIVWHDSGPLLYVGSEKFFFHPSMAKNRLDSFRKALKKDSLIEACGLNKGDSFLDCTLGLGADSIVASYFSETGRIVGLESSPVLAGIIKWGMKLYEEQIWLNEPIHRIEVINCRHEDYLRKAPNNSFDIVYFDPMFRQPTLTSQPISALRKWANPDRIDKTSIISACRVARKRVVLKEKRSSGEFERLGFTKIYGSRHNPIGYGIIEV